MINELIKIADHRFTVEKEEPAKRDGVENFDFLEFRVFVVEDLFTLLLCSPGLLEGNSVNTPS